ncbi:MAG: glycosyltransferase family 1 protein [Candidatus Aenigmatarchaeota archaeon]
MRVGINLVWVKPNNCGGIESYIRNLLDGFYNYGFDDVQQFVLFVSKDNHFTFDKYLVSPKFEKFICNVKSYDVKKRIIWENLNIDRIAKRKRLDLMFIPIYNKPLITFSKIPYVTVIHDLQALHYPEYFSFIKNKWLRLAWFRSAKTSNKIVAISNFVKDDIIERIGVPEEKVEVIYNPILIDEKEEVPFENLAKKYNIKEKEYFYTISSLHPHKNLKTLLYLMKTIKERKIELPKVLVISGIMAGQKKEFFRLIDELDIKQNVIVTGFISNSERNSLYKNAAALLFPSIFEGFGMPCIESMILGTPVVTTKCTAIPEVTRGKAIYVDNPFDVDEWIEKIFYALTNQVTSFDYYSLEFITRKYINMFKMIVAANKKMAQTT